MIKKIGIFALSSLLFLNSLTKAQISYNALDSLQKSLTQAKQKRTERLTEINKLQGEIKNLNAQEILTNKKIKDILAQVDRLEIEREKVRGQIEENERQKLVIESSIDKLQNEIDQLNLKIAEQKAALADVVVNLQRERSTRYVKLLSRSTSFYDLAVRTRYVNLLGKQDIKLIDSLKTNLAKLDQKKLELEAEKAKYLAIIAELDATRQKLNDQQVALTARRIDLNKQLEVLINNKADRQQTLYIAIQERIAIESRIDSLLRGIADERERIAKERRRLIESERKRRAEAAYSIALVKNAEERERLARLESQRRLKFEESQALDDVPLLAKSLDYLSFPIRGQIIENFGSKGQIAIRGRKAEAAVYASADGIVQTATFIESASGYTVAIQHTQDLWTIYSNLKTPLIHQGQWVTRGQLIGYVGGGTLYPSDVLYFKVGKTNSFNLNYVNPTAYFRSGQ